MRQDLTRSFPTENNQYLFIGRSLSLVEVALEAKGISYQTLPLSVGPFDITITPEGEIFLNQEKLTTEQLTRLLDHVSSHLEGLDPRKPIVLLDYVNSGRTFDLVRYIFQTHFPHWTIRSYEVMGENRSAPARWVSRLLEPLLSTRRYFLPNDSPFSRATALHAHKTLSLTGRYALKIQQYTSAPNELAEALRSYLRRYFVHLEKAKNRYVLENHHGQQRSRQRFCRQSFSFVRPY